MYAVLYNRVELVKVLLKYSIDPVPQAVFVALLFRSLAKYNTQPDIHAILSQNSIDFDDLATELFDMGFNDFPERCHGLLTRKLPEFNNLTTLDVAYKGFCLWVHSSAEQQNYSGSQVQIKHIVLPCVRHSSKMMFSSFVGLTCKQLLANEGPVFNDRYKLRNNCLGNREEKKFIRRFVNQWRVLWVWGSVLLTDMQTFCLLWKRIRDRFLIFTNVMVILATYLPHSGYKTEFQITFFGRTQICTFRRWNCAFRL